MQDSWVRYLGQEDPLEEEMATHSSILVWKIPWTEEPGGQQSTGLQRIRRDWAYIHNLFSAQAHLITSTMGKIFCFTVPEKPLLNVTHLNSIFLLSKSPLKHWKIHQIPHPISDIQHCIHCPKHPDTFYSDLWQLNYRLVLNYGSGGLNSLGNYGCHPSHMESDFGSVRNCSWETGLIQKMIWNRDTGCEPQWQLAPFVYNFGQMLLSCERVY